MKVAIMKPVKEDVHKGLQLSVAVYVSTTRSSGLSPRPLTRNKHFQGVVC